MTPPPPNCHVPQCNCRRISLRCVDTRALVRHYNTNWNATSLKTTSCQLTSRWWFWAKWLRSCLWRLVSTGPWYGRRQRIPNSWRRRDTVLRWIRRPRLPIITKLLLRPFGSGLVGDNDGCNYPDVVNVTLACPRLGRSATVPVCLTCWARWHIVDLATLKWRATSICDMPASWRPKIRFRFSLFNLGIDNF